MITIWESTASDLQYHVFFLGVGLARTGSRDSDLTSVSKSLVTWLSQRLAVEDRTRGFRMGCNVLIGRSAGADFTLDAACRTILSKPWKELSEILRAHQTSEQLAEVGFDEKLLRGPEAAIDFKFSYAPPNNHDATKKAITAYRYLKMCHRKTSIQPARMSDASEIRQIGNETLRFKDNGETELKICDYFYQWIWLTQPEKRR